MTETVNNAPVRERKKTNAKGIFAIDRRIWNALARRSISEAACYLGVACGTGGDQMTSGWSATSIEKYLGLNHSMAKRSLELLAEDGYLSVEKRGDFRRYSLAKAHLISEVVTLACKKPAGAGSWTHRDIKDVILTLDEPDWIWLPQSIVKGAVGETSPVRILRQSQNLTALDLFIKLYYHHDLLLNGGVEWRLPIGVRHLYERELIGEYGANKVWKFTPKDAQTNKTSPLWSESFWDDLQFIRDAGLAFFVTHLVEGENADAQIIHPLPHTNQGEPAEQEITRAAMEAGTLMAPPWVKPDGKMIVPVSKLFPNVALVGVLRMRYRLQSARTAQWLDQAPEWLAAADHYRALALRAGSSGIKVTSGIKEELRMQ